MIFLDNGGLVRKPGGERRGNSPGPRVTGLTSQPGLGLTSPNSPPQAIGDLGQISQKGEVGTMEGKRKRCELLKPLRAPQRQSREGAGGQVPLQSQGALRGLGGGSLDPSLSDP